ncbi:MAG: hypothetical protein IIV02_04395 [Peptococcaceae bacterium]|nr:hypothetical protein [Peptococcaceae bacterium]
MFDIPSASAMAATTAKNEEIEKIVARINERIATANREGRRSCEFMATDMRDYELYGEQLKQMYKDKGYSFSMHYHGPNRYDYNYVIIMW